MYKILKIDIDDIDAEGQPIRMFTGREYICTVLNTSSECVKTGKWYFHAQKSQGAVHSIHDYDVISYFAALENHMLPLKVIDDINLVEETKQLFDA